MRTGTLFTAPMKMDTLRSAVEAAGVAMAPADDQFSDAADVTVLVDIANPDGTATNPVWAWTGSARNSVKHWLTVRWPGALST